MMHIFVEEVSVCSACIIIKVPTESLVGNYDYQKVLNIGIAQRKL